MVRSVLICDDDTGHANILAIPFATFTAISAATPSCQHPARPAGCQLDNATVAAAVEKLCLGQRNCILPMGDRNAGHSGGWPSGTVDPCPGQAKRLFVQVTLVIITTVVTSEPLKVTTSYRSISFYRP